MNTAVKVFSATMPTKNAAIHSMESMKRSMRFLRGGAGGLPSVPSRVMSRGWAIHGFGFLPLPASGGEGWGEGDYSRIWCQRISCRSINLPPSPGSPEGDPTSPRKRPQAGRGEGKKRSKPRAVFLQRRLQVGVDRGGVAAGLGHRRGPAVVQRLDRL